VCDEKAVLVRATDSARQPRGTARARRRSPVEAPFALGADDDRRSKARLNCKTLERTGLREVGIGWCIGGGAGRTAWRWPSSPPGRSARGVPRPGSRPMHPASPPRSATTRRKAPTPHPKSDALLRLLICDLVGEEVTRGSMATLRDDITDLRQGSKRQTVRRGSCRTARSISCSSSPSSAACSTCTHS
jgi:hypothetical protein